MVDEDCGIPTSIVDNYRAYQDNGPLAQSDPHLELLSMSEYDKAQNYNLYGESISRPQGVWRCCLSTGDPGGGALADDKYHVKAGSMSR